jgi:hypothetical protein
MTPTEKANATVMLDIFSAIERAILSGWPSSAIPTWSSAGQPRFRMEARRAASRPNARPGSRRGRRCSPPRRNAEWSPAWSRRTGTRSSSSGDSGGSAQAANGSTDPCSLSTPSAMDDSRARRCSTLTRRRWSSSSRERAAGPRSSGVSGDCPSRDTPETSHLVREPACRTVRPLGWRIC